MFQQLGHVDLEVLPVGGGGAHTRTTAVRGHGGGIQYRHPAAGKDDEDVRDEVLELYGVVYYSGGRYDTCYPTRRQSQRWLIVSWA